MNVPLLLFVLVFSLTVHESAHAWTAWRLGDPTGRDRGRISLNPLVHLDWLGSVIVPVVLALLPGGMMFGWAKPVPVDWRNLAHPRRDQAIISAAGPASNLLLALLFAVLLGVVGGLAPAAVTGGVWGGRVLVFLHALANWGILLNVLLALFNLIPVPPLDGSWLLVAVLPGPAARRLLRLGPLGLILLLLLLNGGGGRLLGRWVEAVASLYLGVARAVAAVLT